jgi:hypothetical protein
LSLLHPPSFTSTCSFEFLHHFMPSQLVKPLKTPIRLTFPDGIELISSIDPVTNLHSLQCDLCGKVNQFGLRGAGNSIY